MDDHDLGALLDATVPVPTASDEALFRIHRRAGQRRRRTALAAGALTVALAVATTLGVAALGSVGKKGSVTPAQSTNSQGGTTTSVPDGRCRSGDVSLKIDADPAVSTGSTPGLTRWAVVAESRSATPCRLVDRIKATIRGSDGKVLTEVEGTLNANFFPAKLRYPIDIDPHTPTVVAHLNWRNPCSQDPVELEVGGYSTSVTRFEVPRQPCASRGGSSFSLDGPGPVAGTDCPTGSITLAIVPVTKTVILGALQWEVTATAHTNFLCRVHEGLEARIEAPDGTLIGGIPGNPAPPNDSFRDLFRPQATGSAAYVTWSGPCIDRPMQLVVRPAGTGSPYANAARLSLAKQRCTPRPIGGPRLDIHGAVREP